MISVQALFVAQGPRFKEAKRKYEQETQLHGQAQASSSHTQSAGAPTSVTPAPGTSTTTAGATVIQSQPIPWYARIVLFLCCATPPHPNGY
jgi:hypothetical protein